MIYWESLVGVIFTSIGCAIFAIGNVELAKQFIQKIPSPFGKTAGSGDSDS